MIEQQAAAPFKVGRIRPQMVSRGKNTELLAKTDILSAMVQVLAEGGETNLHAHMATDALWVVLAGQAAFYGEGDRVVARLGRYETLLIPRGTLYWFESTGSEPLVILRVGAKAQNAEDRRVDMTPSKMATRQRELTGAYFEG